MILFIFLLFCANCFAVPIRQWAELDFIFEAVPAAGGLVELCENGLKQSPVDLNTCKNKKNTPLKFYGHSDTRSGGFTLKNTGHSAQIAFKGTAPKLRGGPLNGSYTLAQLHFHWGTGNKGSEHSISGKFYAMEGHFVHYKTSYGSLEKAALKPDGLAVVGIMFKLTSRSNTQFAQIVTGLSNIHSEFSTTNLKSTTVNNWFRPFTTNVEYFTYPGSLTTSPCAESVRWIVLKNKSIISSEQVAEFRKLEEQGVNILENRREIQPINDRTLICGK